MYNFLNKNGYIESTIQKGFTPGTAGTFEHGTYHMAYLIKPEQNKDCHYITGFIDIDRNR